MEKTFKETHFETGAIHKRYTENCETIVFPVVAPQEGTYYNNFEPVQKDILYLNEKIKSAHRQITYLRLSIFLIWPFIICLLFRLHSF